MADGESLLRPWNFDWRHPQVPLDFWHGAQDRTLPLGMARWTWRQIAGKSTFREFAAEGHYSLPLRRLGEILQSWPV
jgi:pimeloyl-ACP methyl ester carboxylesterase